MKKFPIRRTIAAILLLLVGVGAAGFTVWRTYHPAAAPANAEWKKYENKEIGYSLLYPSDFTVYERAIPEDDYFESAIDDPATNARYFFTRSYGRQSDIENVRDYFTGPYPKQIAPSGNLPGQTAVERTLNGMQGIEVYGRGPEGHGFNDQFFYLHNGRLWIISLDPVIEGRATPDDVEPGMPAPAESYKQNYNSILQGIAIADITTAIDEKAALAQLQSDLKNVAPHFVDSSKGTGQTLAAADQKIKEDVAALYSAQNSVAYPNDAILSPEKLLQFDLWLSAIGKRYILITHAGADSAFDEILDSQTGKVTAPAPKGMRYELAPGRNAVLYVAPQAIYAYSLDQASSTLVAGSKLQGTETYHDGVGGLGILVAPQETHTTNSITISIFDSSKIIPNPDGGTKYEKVRDTTLSF